MACRRLVALGVVAFFSSAQWVQALEVCKVKIFKADGTLLVSAKAVDGALLWGNAMGDETNPFFNPACIADGVAKGCVLGGLICKSQVWTRVV